MTSEIMKVNVTTPMSNREKYPTNVLNFYIYRSNLRYPDDRARSSLSLVVKVIFFSFNLFSFFIWFYPVAGVLFSREKTNVCSHQCFQKCSMNKTQSKYIHRRHFVLTRTSWGTLMSPYIFCVKINTHQESVLVLEVLSW